MRAWASFFILYISTNGPTISQEANSYLFSFYNLENLFDTKDDSLTHDEEFTPEGARFWTESKFQRKISRLSSSILSIGEWQPVDLLGVCEVESAHVLNQLIERGGLSKMDYQVVHFESPDRRGIDVALIFRKERLSFIGAQNKKIQLNGRDDFRTRDILVCQFELDDRELFVLVNHWPSKYGGAMATIPLRNGVAHICAALVDSLKQSNPKASVMLMGDFNAEPQEECMNILESEAKLKTSFNSEGQGSNKYQGQWSLIDRIFIDKNFEKDFSLNRSGVHKVEMLLEADEKFLGEKPKRSFQGFKYMDGYSDHLPVFIEFNPRP